MAIEVKMQKEELLRALKYLSPAVTMKGQGNESMIGFEIKPDGIVTLKAGADLCRTRTICAWSGDEKPLESVTFAMESHYLAGALKSLGVASEVRIKVRDDQRLEWYLPNNKGSHTIPTQEDQFQPIEGVLEGAESVFTETRTLDNMSSLFKRAMVMWGLVTPAEREVAQMAVQGGRMVVCSPGFYFVEGAAGLPEGLRVAPEVAEKTQKFIDYWKGHEAIFRIIKTKRWSQMWGVIEVKIGEKKDGDVNVGAIWLFQVRIPDETTEELNATILRMREDQENKSRPGQISLIIENAEDLSRQIGSAVSVTEDSHVSGKLKIIKFVPEAPSQKAALILSSKNAMSASSMMGIPIEVYGLETAEVTEEIEWKVSMVRDILSIFGKNRIVIVFDPNSKRTYFTEYAGASVTAEYLREVFMTHISRLLALKQSSKTKEKEPRAPREKKKRAAVVVGGADEAFSDLMGELLEGDNVQS